MFYYDGKGNLFNSKTGLRDVTTTVIGADLPANAAEQFGVSSEYATAMKNAISAWMAAYAGDDRKVPFIVHTDQHGRLKPARQGLFALLTYLVNWEGVSAIFNLGDTIVDHWDDDDTNTDPLLRNAELEQAMVCLEPVPKEKQVNLYGNHDTWYATTGSVETPISGTLPSLKYLNPYFPACGLRTVKKPDNGGFMAVYDDVFKIKYLVLADWDYAAKQSGSTGRTYYFVSENHVQWIIDEMQKNEGYSNVIVTHVPLEMESADAYDPITGDSIASANPIYFITYSTVLNKLWNDRKNKRSGSVTINSTELSYDFTGCTDDLLCALSGHTHYDGVDYVGTASDGLLNVAFDWFDKNTISFGIIDRVNSQVNVWKLSNDSNTPAVQNWQASFTKPTE